MTQKKWFRYLELFVPHPKLIEVFTYTTVNDLQNMDALENTDVSVSLTRRNIRGKADEPQRSATFLFRLCQAEQTNCICRVSAYHSVDCDRATHSTRSEITEDSHQIDCGLHVKRNVSPVENKTDSDVWYVKAAQHMNVTCHRAQHCQHILLTCCHFDVNTFHRCHCCCRRRLCSALCRHHRKIVLLRRTRINIALMVYLIQLVLGRWRCRRRRRRRQSRNKIPT